MNAAISSFIKFCSVCLALLLRCCITEEVLTANKSWCWEWRVLTTVYGRHMCLTNGLSPDIRAVIASYATHICECERACFGHSRSLYGLAVAFSSSHTVIICEDLCRSAEKGGNQCLSLRHHAPSNPFLTVFSDLPEPAEQLIINTSAYNGSGINNLACRFGLK